jgi:Flp pilus assembly CpaF family ATPase
MRPDRIVIGEIRGAEFISLLQVINNGHAGAAATVHASSETRVVDRLLTLGLLAGVDKQLTSSLISSGIDNVIQLQRVDGLRTVTAIKTMSQLISPLRSVA